MKEPGSAIKRGVSATCVTALAVDAKLKVGNTKARDVASGRSLVWQQDIVQDMRLPISWPQSILWAGAFW